MTHETSFYKTSFFSGVIVLALAMAGCKSTLQVKVSIYNGAITEYRQAQDALALTEEYKKTFELISQQGQALGLNDGSISQTLSSAILDANAAVLTLGDLNSRTNADAINSSNTLSVAQLFNTNRTGQAEVEESLRSSLSKVVKSWPTTKTRDDALSQLAADANALDAAAQGLMRKPAGTPVPAIVVAQARFSERLMVFKKSETAVSQIQSGCLKTLRDLQSAVSLSLQASERDLLDSSGSRYSDFKNILASNPKTDALAVISQLRSVVVGVPENTARIAASDETRRRLVDFDASIDLSDPNWRYLADAPELNWSTFQWLKAEADGNANYIIIQQSMGDFRLKKLFNDPTEGYKAGVNIGKKVFQVVGTAAIAATTGGVALPALAGGSSAGAAPTNNPAPPSPHLEDQVADGKARQAQLELNHSLVKGQLSDLIKEVENLNEPDFTPAYLTGFSNRVAILKELLTKDN